MAGENQYTELGMELPRNFFDLSQEHVFTAEAGIIYPIYQLLLMPGDLIEVNNECVIRQQPTLAPSYSRFKAKFYDVVVALRNLDPDIYRFMSGYEEYTSEEPWLEPLPRWTQTNGVDQKPLKEGDVFPDKYRVGSLWDFLENPCGVILDEDSCQLDYYRQTYGYIWEMLFRNEMRQDSILIKGKPGSWKGEELLRVNFDKDVLTTSLPKQQLGEPYAIPLTGIGSAEWKLASFDAEEKVAGTKTEFVFNAKEAAGQGRGIEYYGNAAADAKNGIVGILNNNMIDFSTAGSILLSNMREMIAYQLMSEINAMAGIRDDEFLEANFGVKPSNEALGYPEVFGKNQLPIVTTDVMQTSESTNTSALGEYAGKGLGVGRSGKNDRFYAKEFAIYMKLMYIKCETLYGGQQAKREYTQKSKYDFPFPQLNHISMQPIYEREINAESTHNIYSKDNGVTFMVGKERKGAAANNAKPKGFQPNFSWYKKKENRISSLLKMEQYYTNETTYTQKEYNYNLYHWSEARFFEMNEEISINNDFLQFKLDNRNYNIVDESIERAQFIVWHKNNVDSWRTMSKKSLPSSLGMIGGF